MTPLETSTFSMEVREQFKMSRLFLRALLLYIKSFCLVRSYCPSSLPTARILKPHTLNPSQGVWVITLKEGGDLEATLDGQFMTCGDY